MFLFFPIVEGYAFDRTVVRWGLPGRAERVTVQYEYGGTSRQAAHFVSAESDQEEGYISTNIMKTVDDNQLGLLGIALHGHRGDRVPLMLKHQSLIVLAGRPGNA